MRGPAWAPLIAVADIREGYPGSLLLRLTGGAAYVLSGLRAGLRLRALSPGFLLLCSGGSVHRRGIAVAFAARLYLIRLNVPLVGRGNLVYVSVPSYLG